MYKHCTSLCGSTFITPFTYIHLPSVLLCFNHMLLDYPLVQSSFFTACKSPPCSDKFHVETSYVALHKMSHENLVRCRLVTISQPHVYVSCSQRSFGMLPSSLSFLSDQLIYRFPRQVHPLFSVNLVCTPPPCHLLVVNFAGELLKPCSFGAHQYTPIFVGYAAKFMPARFFVPFLFIPLCFTYLLSCWKRDKFSIHVGLFQGMCRRHQKFSFTEGVHTMMCKVFQLNTEHHD